MAQRLWIELDRRNHHVHVHIARDAEGMCRAVEEYGPDLIVAPYLKRRIPAEVYERYVCLVVHPGIVGDRGASSLDRAILRGERRWGVTILQAVEKMDAGPVWAFHDFDMRPVSKAALYRCEVTQAAAKGVIEAVEKFQSGARGIPAEEYPTDRRGRWYPSLTQAELHFDWGESTADIWTKVRAADSAPGAWCQIGGKDYLAYGAHLEGKLRGVPGEILAQRDKAVCVATGDGALWITHLKEPTAEGIKLPASMVLGQALEGVPELPLSPLEEPDYPTWQEIRVRFDGPIAYVYFDFYNGAMDVDQCQRLRQAIIRAKERSKMLVLMGGMDLWSNGIHLNIIEASEDPAQSSWENIHAINDLIREVILSTDHYVVAAMHGNAGAGGVPFALAADKVYARQGIVLNPHTRNMGLYGSEYWTYLLPRRIGIDKATRFTEECLPWGVEIAKEIGLIDDYYGQTVAEFSEFVRAEAERILSLKYFDKLIKAKKFQRLKDERNKPLESYRAYELEQMRKNFFEDNWQYHYRRHCFVYKKPMPWEERNLYAERRKIFRRRKWESIEYEG